VAGELLDDLDPHAGREHERARGVPGVMEPDSAKTELCDELVKSVGKVVRVVRAPEFVAQHVALALPRRPSGEALRLLLDLVGSQQRDERRVERNEPPAVAVTTPMRPIPTSMSTTATPRPAAVTGNLSP
jgi:hypothetical protein